MITRDTTSLAYALIYEIEYSAHVQLSLSVSLSLPPLPSNPEKPFLSTYRQFLQAPARALLGLSVAIAAAAAAVVVAMISERRRGENGGGKPLCMLQPGLWGSLQSSNVRTQFNWQTQLDSGRVLVGAIGSDIMVLGMFWSCGSFERFLA